LIKRDIESQELAERQRVQINRAVQRYYRAVARDRNSNSENLLFLITLYSALYVEKRGADNGNDLLRYGGFAVAMELLKNFFTPLIRDSIRNRRELSDELKAIDRLQGEEE
jgi:hypothetical protein